MLRPKAEELYNILIANADKNNMTTITDYYLMNLLKCGKSFVQSLISELEHNKYITREKTINKRYIRIIK